MHCQHKLSTVCPHFLLFQMLISFILVVLTAAGAAEKFDVKTFNGRVKREGEPETEAKIAIIPPIRPPYPPVPVDYNATSLYDSRTERCCKGSVHKGSPKAPLECCGTNIRDKSTQLCCEGTVHNIKIGSLCCGNQTYDTKSDICCDNTVVCLPQGTKPENADCCAKNAYDTNTQLCCYNYEKNYQAEVVTKQSKTDDQCCGLKTYSTKRSTCCYDYSSGRPQTFLLTVVGNKTTCCGKKLIDYATELCCDGIVIERKGGDQQLSCCGKDVYNYEKQVCCYNNGKSKVLEKRSPTDSCCGSELYDYKKQLCCYQKVIDNPNGQEQCCGETTINTKTHVCCYVKGKFVGVKKNGENDNQCCGAVTYDYQTALCCYHNNIQTVVKKSHPQDNQCCGGIRTYKYGKDICCKDESPVGLQKLSIVRPSPINCGFYNRACCGGKSIDTTKGYCCGTKKIKYTKTNQLACCGNGVNALTYNPNKDFCCYDYSTPELKPRIVSSSKGNACCGDKVYNYTANLQCCKGKLHKTNGVSEYCCGNKIYNYQVEECCGENVLKKKGNNYQCCYNSNTDEDQDCLTRVYPIVIQRLQEQLQEGGGVARPLAVDKKKKK